MGVNVCCRPKGHRDEREWRETSHFIVICSQSDVISEQTFSPKKASSLRSASHGQNKLKSGTYRSQFGAGSGAALEPNHKLEPRLNQTRAKSEPDRSDIAMFAMVRSSMIRFIWYIGIFTKNKLFIIITRNQIACVNQTKI